MQAQFDNESQGSTDGFFFSGTTGSSGFNLRFFDGPRAGQTFGNRTEPLTAVSNGPVTGEGTAASPFTNVTVYTVPDSEGTDPLVEVRQTARYVNGQSNYRMTYEVINRHEAPLRFRAMTAGDLFVDGDDTGVGVLIATEPRFVGGTNTNSRITGGAEEVRSSRLPGDPAPVPVAPWAAYEVNHYSTVYSRMRDDSGFQNTIQSSRVDNGVGVQWDDHRAEGAGLAPGASARYEVLWKVRQPVPLTLSPPTAVPEIGSEHVITAALRDSADQPVEGVTLRYGISGANPTEAEQAVTTAGGAAEIRWTGAAEGRDTLTVYADYDGDGVRDGDEPAQSATADWRPETDVDPPSAGQVSTPAGDPVRINVQTNPDDPTRQYFSIAHSQAGLFEACPEGGQRLNLPLNVPIRPGSGAVVPGSVELLLVDPVSDDVTRPIRTIAFSGDAPADGVYGFTIECVLRTDLYVRYTLEEEGTRDTFVVPIGGLVLIDPQGVVYDRSEFDEGRARGLSPEQARAEAAIEGATVRLQRLVGGEWRNVLSGDPGIAPNVNPQITGADGLYQWDVSAGAYRVVVSASGYDAVTTRAVDIPPPVLDLHVPMGDPAPPPPPPPPPVPPTPPVPPVPPAVPVPVAPVAPAAPQALVNLFPAKLQVERARVRREERRLDVLAPITGRASGEVEVEFFAAQRRFDFTEDVDSDARRVKFNRRIPAEQARLGTGIMTITYPGDGDTPPQEVRLRAASQPADLELERPRIEDGRLKARGTISDRARGVVRLQLQYVVDGQAETVELRGRIDDERWEIDEALSQEVRDGIARRTGSVHSYTLFTGYFEQRIRGEMKSFQVRRDR
jgi:hypothetical protein